MVEPVDVELESLRGGFGENDGVVVVSRPSRFAACLHEWECSAEDIFLDEEVRWTGFAVVDADGNEGTRCCRRHVARCLVVVVVGDVLQGLRLYCIRSLRLLVGDSSRVLKAEGAKRWSAGIGSCTRCIAARQTQYLRSPAITLGRWTRVNLGTGSKQPHSANAVNVCCM